VGIGLDRCKKIFIRYVSFNPIMRGIVMQKIFLGFLSFFILVFFSLNGYADTAYTVRRGDSLYSISKNYNVPLNEIKKASNLRASKLKPGMSLIIPEGTAYKKNFVKSAASKKVKRASSKKKPLQGPATSKTYTIKKGDTLWKIAKGYRISPKELKQMNKLTNNKLQVGQKIYVAKNHDIAQKQENYTDRDLPSPNAKLEELKAEAMSEDMPKVDPREQVVELAKKMMHFPYKFGGNGSFGLDCSAFVQKIYSLIGLELPRSAREQFKTGEAVNKDNLSKGDIVFFRTYAPFPSHVGIYIGENLFIHASSIAKKVVIDSMESPYYLKRFIGAKRLLPMKTVEAW